MIQIFKNIFILRKKISVYKLFSTRHRRIFNNGEFIRNNLTRSEKRKYKEYWGKISKTVNFETVEICKSLSGKFDVKIIPEEIFELYIQPCLQSVKNLTFLANKNIYNKWFEKGLFPKDYFHKINGAFYDPDLNLIPDFKKYLLMLDIDYPVVLKPSIDSSGGEGILFLDSKKEIEENLKLLEYAVVQDIIQQHTELDVISSNGLNTIRVCLLKRPSNSEIAVLNTSLRMGKDGGLDNETAGGIVCNISNKGILNSFAVDALGKKYYKHPNTGFVFKEKKLPRYEELLVTSKRIAEKIVYANLIGLDMCLDHEGVWRCIEVNLKYQSIRFAQYAGRPFFGEYTDEVIQYILEKNRKQNGI